MIYDRAQVKGSLKPPPLVALGIVIALVIVIEMMILEGYRQLRENTDEVSGSQVAIRATEGVPRSILNMGTGLRGFVITGDKAFLQPYQSGRKAFADAISHALASTAPYPKQQVLLEKVRDLINRILDLGKMDSRVMDHRAAVIDVVNTLRRAAGLNRAYPQTLWVHFEPDLPADHPQVQALSDRLMQTLTNLLSHAAKFSPKYESVTQSCRIAGKKVRVKIDDRSPGIPPDFRGRFFGKFARAEASDTRQMGSIGLGLSIAKSRVEKCGGPSTAYTNRATARPSSLNLPFTASSRRQRDWIIPSQPERR